MTGLAAAISGLREAYRADRDAVSASASPLASVDPAICRYCGKGRVAYPNSKLDGHGACMVSPEFKRRLALALRDPRITYELLAEAFDVGVSTIRAWYRDGLAEIPC